ncbi:MAG: electron transfer flavoprotein subunit beta [Velocimicrobium sp.]
MKIIVCMKQVPASSKVEVDPENGTLKRMGVETKTNPYDLFGLETALQIREKVGGTVTVLTMGPAQAKEMMYDAFAMGADDAVILSDKKFAGSDVLATSYTLSQGIRALLGADLIICGKQTTDGDTAQIGPAIAEHLNIPHAAWVSKISGVDEEKIRVNQNLGSVSQLSEMRYPCLITVENDIVVARLPSYRKMKKIGQKEIQYLSFENLPDKNLSRYGLIGSPTSVEKIFPPETKNGQEYIKGNIEEKIECFCEILKAKKFML